MPLPIAKQLKIIFISPAIGKVEDTPLPRLDGLPEENWPLLLTPSAACVYMAVAHLLSLLASAKLLECVKDATQVCRHFEGVETCRTQSTFGLPETLK